MKLIVTGGTGFLGRHVVWRLARAGHEVVFTGRDAAQAQLVLRLAAPGAPAPRFVQLDHGGAGAGAALNALGAGCGAMVHCAALASPWGSARSFRRSNVDATGEVLDACAANGVERLVHISTPSIYFDYTDRLQVREDAPLPPGVNEYARSKLLAELLVQGASTSDLPLAVILRPRAIFGPWDQALLPRLLRLLQYGRVPLLRGGRALLDLTYVDNAVDAVELALAAPAARLGARPVVNISNGEPVEAARLFALLAAQFGLALDPARRNYALAHIAAGALEALATLRPGWEPPFTRYSLGTLAFSQTLDLKRARSLLGYRPAVGLDEGIARTAAWWRAGEGRA